MTDLQFFLYPHSRYYGEVKPENLVFNANLQEDLEIKSGDIVRLLKPFRPERYGFQEYAFGVVAGVVTEDSTRSKNHQSISDSQQPAGHQSRLDGLVVYLYEPDSSTTYVDQFGVKALFSFDSDEVALYKSMQTPASQQN